MSIGGKFCIGPVITKRIHSRTNRPPEVVINNIMNRSKGVHILKQKDTHRLDYLLKVAEQNGITITEKSNGNITSLTFHSDQPSEEKASIINWLNTQYEASYGSDQPTIVEQ